MDTQLRDLLICVPEEEFAEPPHIFETHAAFRNATYDEEFVIRATFRLFQLQDLRFLETEKVEDLMEFDRFRLSEFGRKQKASLVAENPELGIQLQEAYRKIEGRIINSAPSG